MNYLYVFIGILFIIGLLLVTMSFYAYSKLGVQCVSDSLKTKLRIAIVIGSALLALAAGFYICIRHASCVCPSLGESTNEMYFMTGFSLISGIILMILTFGINSDLKDPSCNVDLGMFPWFLGGIATIQIVLSVVYIIYTIRQNVEVKNVNGGYTIKLKNKPQPEELVESSSESSSSS